MERHGQATIEAAGGTIARLPVARELAGADRLSRRTVVRCLARAIEQRDRDVGSHVERVGAICELICLQLGLAPERVELIAEAAVLHDVGKLCTPEAILFKQGPLTPEERLTMQEHAEYGYELLSGTGDPLLDLAAEIALTHHERFDGTGYPCGLVGEEIPLPGRVVAVADVFDALTSDRSYRKAFPLPQAIKMMQGGSGHQFDPSVLSAFFARLPEML